jgi:hypothetical protein
MHIMSVNNTQGSFQLSIPPPIRPVMEVKLPSVDSVFRIWERPLLRRIILETRVGGTGRYIVP